MLVAGAVAALVAGLLVVVPRELGHDTTSAALGAAAEDTADDELESRGPGSLPDPAPSPRLDDPLLDDPLLDDPTLPDDLPPLSVPALPPEDLFDDEALQDLLGGVLGECLDVALALSALLFEPLTAMLGDDFVDPGFPSDPQQVLESLPPELQGPAEILRDAYAPYADAAAESGPFSDEALAALDSVQSDPAAVEALDAFDTWFVANCG